jgi:hypothetical protein
MRSVVNASRAVPIPRKFSGIVPLTANAPAYVREIPHVSEGLPRVLRRSGATRFLLILPLVGGIFLSRFAVPFSGRQLSVSLLVILASIIGLAALGRLRVHVPRFILFALSIAAMITATVFGGTGRVSVMSFLLLAVLYLSYVFVVYEDDTTYAWLIRAFRRIYIIIAVAGIIQSVAQLVLPGPTLFTFQGIVPDAYLALEYNYVDPSDFLPGFNKSNGVFLPEPSIFGQLMGLAAILEVLFFRPSYRLSIIGLALFLSFSGTGVMLCVVFIPLLLLRRGNPTLLFLGAILGVVLLVFSDTWLLAPFLGRVGEFGAGATHSSGFARFLSPFYLFDDFIFTSVRSTLFGLGPGAIETFFSNYYTEVHDPTWGKLFFEYGLIGTLPFALFITCSFFADAPAKWFAGALFLNWLVMGGYLLSAPIAGLVLPLSVWHRAARMHRAARVSDKRVSFITRPPLHE